MGKKDAKSETKDKAKEEIDDEEDNEFEEEKRDLQQIEIGDFVKVKQCLDEAVIKADLDYTENHYWDNIKLSLMVVACLFAMVAQFYPMPFPESRPLLGVCCAAYFVASSVLQLIVTYVDQDCIMITGPTVDAETGKALPLPPLDDEASKAAAAVGGGERNKTRAGGVTGLRICTNFPRFSYDFTVAVQLNLKSEPKAPPPNICSMRFKIHDYFTEDEGLFDDDRFERHVATVVKDFENGDYYTDRAWTNKGEGKKDK